MTTDNDIFRQINNAVLDLQSAELQTYERPLKQLARLLQDECLQESNQLLVSTGVDVQAFIDASEATGGGMVGSHHLDWPDDPRQALALTLHLIVKLADDSRFALNFSHTFYYSGPKVMAGIHAMTRQLIIPFVRDYKTFVLSNGKTEPRVMQVRTNRIFIVHGHDGEARETVARFLERVGFVPIILHEQANMGRTVIEKVVANSDVGFAVVLLTPDDVGRATHAPDLEPRARQNVLLELGYFIGHLGREKVCALKKGEVTIPSDFGGVVWQEMDAAGAWKAGLGRELSAAGYTIDWNKLMSA
ncbi:nucleotide-binding protein [Variovorax fucosicus]|uniref:nucleotide-binding protein n=1 Tax=Variovorax fucosicus TaxID=3053517 RepID=UPI002578E0DD|nr:nucleotide-binding protein [Variovorax sp. J22G47]MDM0055231.1 nucleotide-binding protein [Variovorax sp. J22G47]